MVKMALVMPVARHMMQVVAMDDGSATMPIAGVMPRTVASMAPVHAPATPMNATTVATKMEADATTMVAVTATATHNT
jgi:hypothetical protein